MLDLQGNLNSNVATANGNLGILYGRLNNKRLPTYHRMDISIKRKFAVSENGVLEVNAGVTNVYNRENVFYFNRITNRIVNQLPILPSIGLNMTF
jgi:hypothetical protein